MSESNCFLVTSSTSCLLLKLTEAQNPTKINNLYQNIFTTNYRLVQNSKKKIYHRLFFIILQEELACYTNRRQKYTRLLRRLFLNFQLLLLVFGKFLGKMPNFWTVGEPLLVQYCSVANFPKLCFHGKFTLESNC